MIMSVKKQESVAAYDKYADSVTLDGKPAVVLGLHNSHYTDRYTVSAIDGSVSREFDLEELHHILTTKEGQF